MGPKKQFFDYVFAVFPYIWPLLWKKLREGFGMASGRVWKAGNFVNAGFWRLRAPETSIWAPEGAFGPKKAIFPSFFHNFFEDYLEFFGDPGRLR